MNSIEAKIKEIKRTRNKEAQKKWAAAHPEKKKELSSRWNDKNRNVYQRFYRYKQFIKDKNMIVTLVPYDLALQLRNIGFNEPCVAWFVMKDKILYSSFSSMVDINDVKSLIRNDSLPKDVCTCPTYDQVFYWLELHYGAFMDFATDLGTTGPCYDYTIRFYNKKEDWVYNKEHEEYTNLFDSSVWTDVNKEGKPIRTKTELYRLAIQDMLDQIKLKSTSIT